MNPRTTGILAIVALLFGAYVYFYEIGGEADRKSAEQAESRIFGDLDAHAIDAIAFRTLDGVDARFERVQGAWRLVAPVDAPADPTSLEAIASVLAGVSRAGSVETTGDLGQYGLGEGARVVEFSAQGKSQALRIGRSTPVGGNLYVLGGDALVVDAPSEVAFVEKFRLNALSRKLDDLRDRRVLRFDPTQVRRLELAWPGAKVVLERTLDGDADSDLDSDLDGASRSDWRLTAPVAEAADQMAVRDLLTNLEFLQSNGFVDEPDERSREALSELALEVRLDTPAGSRRLRIGGSISDAHIALGQDDRLFSLAPERLDDFERTITAYRDRTVARFDLTAARVLEVEAFDANEESQRLRAELDEQGWQSEDLPLDSGAVAVLIQDLSQLRADSILADSLGPSELAPLGLAPPRLRLRVLRAGASAENGGILAEIALGRRDEGKGLLLQRSGEAKIYVLDFESEVELPNSWESFRAEYARSEPPSDPSE